MRPERVQLGPAEDVAESTSAEGGSRLEGTVAEVVYLGMYTQFHIETAAGRVVSNRLADELVSPPEPRSRVLLTWGSDQTSVLGASARPEPGHRGAEVPNVTSNFAG